MILRIHSDDSWRVDGLCCPHGSLDHHFSWKELRSEVNVAAATKKSFALRRQPRHHLPSLPMHTTELLLLPRREHSERDRVRTISGPSERGMPIRRDACSRRRGQGYISTKCNGVQSANRKRRRRRAACWSPQGEQVRKTCIFNTACTMSAKGSKS